MNIRIAVAAEKRVRKSIAGHWSAVAAFRDVVGFASAKQKSPTWKKVAALRIDEDLDSLTAWLREVFEKEPPAAKINGLWFGLFEDAGTGWTVYVAGSKRYSRKGNLDWAVQPAWWPKRRYANSKVLRQLTAARPRRDFDTSWLIETCAVLPYAAIAVSEMLRRLDPELVLGSAMKRGVACGFDDGDCTHLGEVTARGFEAYRV